MTIAAILSLVGMLIGLSHRYAAILVASVATTAMVLGLSIVMGELGLWSIAVLMGYLLALQSGYVVGAYIALARDE